MCSWLAQCLGMGLGSMLVSPVSWYGVGCHVGQPCVLVWSWVSCWSAFAPLVWMLVLGVFRNWNGPGLCQTSWTILKNKKQNQKKTKQTSPTASGFCPVYSSPEYVLMNVAILLYIVDSTHAWRDVILASNAVPSNLTEWIYSAMTLIITLILCGT